MSVSDLPRLVRRLAAERCGGRRVVLTNGCFDLLHIGHIRYLYEARSRGDLLVVGVNSDESVRLLKGNGRPINPAWERAAVLAALAIVDHVIIFDELNPANLIRQLCPDVYVKGGDYTLDTLPERALVESLGGRVEILGYVAGHSTSQLIERMRATEPDRPLLATLPARVTNRI
jgi:rfaE bifunctional protein nucleotidyltransferase chain/domain